MSRYFFFRAFQCFLFGHRWFNFRMDGDRAGRCCTRCMRMEQRVNLQLQAGTAWAPMQRGNAGG